ncbi:MAG: NUDIX domain-containing protein [Dehalococcoidia bacterium]
MTRTPRIRPIALAVIRRGDQLLLDTGFDSLKQEHFARTPGGGIEFGERAEEAVRREIREEYGLTLVDARLLGVLENIFVYEGEPGHEIVYVFEGRFAESWPYEHDTLPAEEGGRAYESVWMRPQDVLDRGWQLHPDGFPALLGLRRTSV